jgi:hypothetical protein
MNIHSYSKDDLFVVSFAAAILTIKNVPVGLAFRFVTDAKGEYVIHVFSKTLEEQIELFSAVMEKRERSFAGDELQAQKTTIAISSLVFKKFFPTLKDSDLNCNDSRSIVNITYIERQDGIVMIVTYMDKSSRTFIISDYLVYKMLKYAQRFFAFARIPNAGKDDILH